MLRQFCTLEPVLLSLGSSRTLWEDAAVVPQDIIMYGNLPSKHFYSDAVSTVTQVEAQTCELLGRMADTGHPFILGSECDVLHVPGSGETIRKKVEAFVGCRCDGIKPIRRSDTRRKPRRRTCEQHVGIGRTQRTSATRESGMADFESRSRTGVARSKRGPHRTQADGDPKGVTTGRRARHSAPWPYRRGAVTLRKRRDTARQGGAT